MLNTYTKIVSLFHWFSQNFVFYIHWIFFHIFFKITFISFFIEFYIYCSSCLFDEFLKLHFDISSTLSDTVLDSTFNLISLMCALHSPFVFSSYCFGTGFLWFLHWVWISLKLCSSYMSIYDVSDGFWEWVLSFRFKILKFHNMFLMRAKRSQI